MNRSDRVKKTVPLLNEKRLRFPMHYHLCALHNWLVYKPAFFSLSQQVWNLNLEVLLSCYHLLSQ